jgi:hypothetical protein
MTVRNKTLAYSRPFLELLQTVQKPLTILIASKQVWKEPIYKAAVERYRDQCSLVESKDLFEHPKDYRLNYPDYLYPFKAAIVVYDGGFIGKGVYDEIYQLVLQQTPIFVFDGSKEYYLNRVKLYDSLEDWSRYATLEISEV